MEEGAKRRDLEAAKTANPKTQIPSSKETTKSQLQNGRRC